MASPAVEPPVTPIPCEYKVLLYFHITLLPVDPTLCVTSEKNDPYTFTPGAVGPVGPVNPVEPVGPVGPVLPVDPVEPVGPVNPFAPIGP